MNAAADKRAQEGSQFLRQIRHHFHLWLLRTVTPVLVPATATNDAALAEQTARITKMPGMKSWLQG